MQENEGFLLENYEGRPAQFHDSGHDVDKSPERRSGCVVLTVNEIRMINRGSHPAQNYCTLNNIGWDSSTTYKRQRDR